MTTRFCVSCRHYRPLYSDCNRPPSDAALNLVTGKPLGRVPTDAWYERYPEPKYADRDLCGTNAKYFEAIE